MLVETHGALRDAYEIAALPWVQVLDFGLMDFVSGFHGAIAASNMRSPGQFDHRAIAYAKARVVSAAMCSGVVPAHNVTLDLKNQYQTYADAKRARDEFGFLRMWSIYPAQIQPIVDAMKPNYEEVQRSGRDPARGAGRELGPDPVRRRAARPRDVSLLLGAGAEGARHRHRAAGRSARALLHLIGASTS